MVMELDPPLKPRGRDPLNVLLICRISTVHQDLRSLDDQEALLRKYIDDHYDGPVNFRCIRSQGSGEVLGTREILEAVALVENREVDVVMAEDLGRVCRRNFAIQFCETCEDNDTRMIALNDNIDTGRNDWHMNALFSSFKHESSNRDTSQRIRRTMRNRFTQGGIVQTTIFGYIKPPGTKTDSDLHKDPAAGPIYDEMFRRLEEGANFSEVADWLNGSKVSPGPFCRSGRWTGAMVMRIVQNPILKGIRVRNKKKARRNNKTGVHRSVDAPPEDLLERHCPHLAFIEPLRFDRVNAMLRIRNARYKRGKDGVDPRKNVSKKQTRWPGQHIDCGVCGRLFRYGGHGQTDHLMCGGAYDYECWNGITVDGPLAAEKLSRAILREIEALPGSESTFSDLLNAEVDRIRVAQGGRRVELDRLREKLDRQLANITAALREAGPSTILVEELKALENDRDRLHQEQAALDRLPRQMITIPSLAVLKSRAAKAMADLAVSSPEFGRLMRRLIARIEVFPFRLVDGGTPVLRARFTLDLVALIPEAQGLEGCLEILRRELSVDLFDPPQRAAYRERVLALRAQGLTEKEIGARLELTITAVQRAAALDREMIRRGVTDPYVPMTGPSDDCPRITRHKNPRYRFKPKGGDAA